MKTGIFDESFEEWNERTGGTIAEWRRLSVSAWDRIRTSDHYHGGKPCREAKCSRYPNA